MRGRVGRWVMALAMALACVVAGGDLASADTLPPFDPMWTDASGMTIVSVDHISDQQLRVTWNDDGSAHVKTGPYHDGPPLDTDSFGAELKCADDRMGTNATWNSTTLPAAQLGNSSIANSPQNYLFSCTASAGQPLSVLVGIKFFIFDNGSSQAITLPASEVTRVYGSASPTPTTPAPSQSPCNASQDIQNCGSGGDNSPPSAGTCHASFYNPISWMKCLFWPGATSANAWQTMKNSIVGKPPFSIVTGGVSFFTDAVSAFNHDAEGCGGSEDPMSAFSTYVSPTGTLVYQTGEAGPLSGLMAGSCQSIRASAAGLPNLRDVLRVALWGGFLFVMWRRVNAAVGSKPEADTE